MHFLDILQKKRDGGALSREEIASCVASIVSQSVPDYQVSALLMAIFLNGMTDEETVNLTLEMAHSGQTIDLSDIPGIKVDKHSSGGVGDTCTLIVAPIVAALGYPVVKLSGRGLGFTGGTIDKLESIAGFRVDLDLDAFIEQAKSFGLVVSGQTRSIAPADGLLYALRDVTRTVDSIPLIASSIMSKKLASGSNATLLNITCGQGAFMKNFADAKKLAEQCIRIGVLANHPVQVVISTMDEPLGYAVGNVLEVQEAYRTLCGRGPADLVEIVLNLAAGMLNLAKAGSFEACLEQARGVLESGQACDKFKEWIKIQGGKLDDKGEPIYRESLHSKTDIIAREDGYLTHLSALKVGEAACLAGAGRMTKSDEIDYAAGIILNKKVGDFVKKDEVLASIYAVNIDRTELAREVFERGITLSENPPEKNKHVLAILDGGSL